MNLNQNESEELTLKSFTDWKIRNSKELIRKVKGYYQRLGEKAETFTLFVYQDPGNGSFNMSYHLPEGQVFPDLTELVSLMLVKAIP